MEVTHAEPEAVRLANPAVPRDLETYGRGVHSPHRLGDCAAGPARLPGTAAGDANAEAAVTPQGLRPFSQRPAPGDNSGHTVASLTGTGLPLHYPETRC